MREIATSTRKRYESPCPGKLRGDEPVSTTLVKGAIESFARFCDPPTRKFQPGGVRKVASTWKVITPGPNSDTGVWLELPPRSGMLVIADDSGPPSHVASKPWGLRISQPRALAIVGGRQRRAQDSGVASIQPHETGAGRISGAQPGCRQAVSSIGNGVAPGRATIV